MRFALKYDMRSPQSGPPLTALYRTCLEQCAAADRWGFERVFLLEHHGAEDNYCSSPLVLGAAIAGCTSNLIISPAALIAPLHDPLRIAEDLAVLDQISAGRLEVVLGVGYAPHEFEMFDRKLSDRGASMSETIDVLKLAWTGESFSFRGREVRVTPRPARRPRPPIYLGGTSRAAARRAAREADGFWPLTEDLQAVYLAECERLGKTPGALAPRGYAIRPFANPRFVLVTEDPERDWDRVIRHAMHETLAYARLVKSSGSQQQGRTPGAFQNEDVTPADVRNGGNYMVMTPDACARMYEQLGPNGMVVLLPLLAGLDPDLSWTSLDLFANRVMPRLRCVETLPGNSPEQDHTQNA